MKHIKHLVLVFVLAGIVVVVGAVVLQALVPESYGTVNEFSFRTASIQEEASEEVVYPDDTVCMSDDCHGVNAEEDFAVIMGGGHKQIACQSCHGLLDPKHIESNGKEAKPQICPAYYDEENPDFPDQFNTFCLSCHKEAPGKPESFPQLVDFPTHLKDFGGSTEKSCYDCHDHHSCETF